MRRDSRDTRMKAASTKRNRERGWVAVTNAVAVHARSWDFLQKDSK